MIPCADNEILKEFEPLAIGCKPEAPWIKRCNNGIKFTEEIQDDNKIVQNPGGKYFCKVFFR